MKMPLNPHITYTSPRGREYRIISIEKVPETSKWIDRAEHWHWKITIKYLDTGELKELYYDWNDKLYRTSPVVWY